MKFFLADTAVTVRVEFTLDGDPVVPDDDSVVYTVRDASGTAIVGLTDVVGGNGSTGIDITVSAEVNETTVDPEARFITLVWKKDDKTYQVSESYLLVEFAPISITKSDVRDLVGFSVQEIPDDAIDIIRAYHDLSGALGTTFTTALSGGGVKGLNANQLIGWTAINHLIASLPFRMMQSARSDDAAFSRMAELDFSNLAQRVRGKIAELRTSLDATDVAATPIFTIFSEPTDVITG